MKSNNLAFKLSNEESHRLFSVNQLEKIKHLHIPVIIRFMLAEKFDTKFINSTSNIWDFKYSGLQNFINFEGFDEFETKLIKYFLAYHIQINSPSGLYGHFNQIRKTFNFLITEEKSFSFDSFKNILIDIAKNDNGSQKYYTVKSFVNLMLAEKFHLFKASDENELELIERPPSLSSRFYYQENDDVINKPLVTMIQNGFAKLNTDVLNHTPISDKAIRNASILGLVYTTGLRPVQLAKLAVEDIKADTHSETGEFLRYSILVPYAKQGQIKPEKIAIKLPEEIATIIFQYIKQYALQKNQQLFNLQKNAVLACNDAINEQLFEFSPKEYQRQIMDGELIQIKYTSSQFRHHVAYSMALGGASAEDIAYILGHSSLVVARNYIYSSPNLAQIRAMALGRNPLYQQMIAMLMTGDIIAPNKAMGKNVIGFVNGTIHSQIGKCSYKSDCFLEPVRSCYGCVYFHPYLNGKHSDVLDSVQQEIEVIMYISDRTFNSSNSLISVHESTKFEIESVIRRCHLIREVNNATTN